MAVSLQKNFAGSSCNLEKYLGKIVTVEGHKWQPRDYVRTGNSLDHSNLIVCDRNSLCDPLTRMYQ